MFNLFKKLWPKKEFTYEFKGLHFKKKDYAFFWRFRINKFIPQERGLYQIAYNLIEPGMRVNIIAGGSGITALFSLKKLNNNGNVTIYEGGRESVDNINRNLSFNGFENFKTIHGIVGEEINVYGGSSVDAIHIKPSEIEDCDYLELDCEGSEKDILQNMVIKPKFITIEIHPNLIKESYKWLFNWVKNNSYKILSFSGHDGFVLNESMFKELYNHNLSRSNKYIDNTLARAPMIISLQKI